MSRKPPEQPDFSPDLIKALDWLQRRLTQHVAGGGGLHKRYVLAATIALWSASEGIAGFPF